MRCSRCQTENPDGSGFCRECGSPLEGRCPACRAQVEAGVSFCPACGTALAPAGPAVPPAPKPPATRPGSEAERKLVTVLFCDIVGSTALTERLGAEAMHELLGRFYDLALERCISTAAGWASSWATASWPSSDHGDQARPPGGTGRARAAAAPGRGSAALGPSVSVGGAWGIDTGVVVVGSVGDDLDAELAAIGTGQRGRAPPGPRPSPSHPGQRRDRPVGGWLRVAGARRRGPCRRSAPVVAHRVVGVGPRRSPLEGLGSLPLGRFVGRERQLARSPRPSPTRGRAATRSSASSASRAWASRDSFTSFAGP